MEKYSYKGWGMAIINFFIFWALMNVYMGVAAKVFAVNKIIFSCASTASASILLLIIAGKGKLGKETIKSPQTWYYGISLLLGYIFTIYLFSYTSSTIGSLLQRSSLIITPLITAYISKDSIHGRKITGMALVLAGIVTVSFSIEKSAVVPALFFAIGFALIQSGRVIISQNHKEFTKAMKKNSIQDKCRVVGLVMLCTSVIFFLVLISIAYIWPDLAIVSQQSLAHVPSIYLGIACGLILVASIRYLEFSTLQSIKSDNYIALTALTPLATFLWEILFSKIFDLDLKLKTFTNFESTGLLIITAGAFLMLAKNKKILPD